MERIVYIPWLHMHQPLVWKNEKLISNLQKMIESKNWNEKWNGLLIARAYKNPAKYVYELSSLGYKPKIMLDFSGILLESLNELSQNGFFDNLFVYKERIGNIIELYRRVLNEFPDSIEFAGSAYSHCYFPATPIKDWELQIKEWRNVFKKIFGLKILRRVKGFWLPEMGVPPEIAHGSLRFSLGRDTTEGDIDRVIEVLPPIVEKLRVMSPFGKNSKSEEYRG